MNNELLELWSIWETSLHNEEEQIKRQKSATSSKCTPKKLDDNVGVFKGSSKDYITTLTDCQCRDYALRRFPCKHMYRLAHELGVFVLNSTVSSNENISSELRMDDILPTLESLDKETLLFFAYQCYHLGNDNKNGPLTIKIDDWDLFQKLLDNKLLVGGKDYKASLSHLKVAELKELCKASPTKDIPKKKPDLVEYVLNNYDVTDVNFSKIYATFELSPEIKHMAFSLHKRIHSMYPNCEANSYFL
ncbi:MAG: SWIM zinc finger domain-containing protein [Lachnospiraceae bacterium]|nr:SWIM zinc finger domain-containing protein [Lachnospiraceae bacterium]